MHCHGARQSCSCCFFSWCSSEEGRVRWIVSPSAHCPRQCEAQEVRESSSTMAMSRSSRGTPDSRSSLIRRVDRFRRPEQPACCSSSSTFLLKKLLRATEVNVRKPFGDGGWGYAPDRLARTRSAPFSPIMMVVALVLPPMMDGITEASITRRLSTPRTWSSGSTTESSSRPSRRSRPGGIGFVTNAGCVR